MKKIIRLGAQSILRNRACMSTLNKNFIEAVRTQSPAKEYPGFTPIIKTAQENKIRVIEDKELNLKFLIESSGFPGCTDLGICINLGTQDQNNKNAGSLHYLKNFVHIKETFEQIIKNYDFYQQSGSMFDFTYDHTFAYVKGSFFSEDIDVMLDLLLDLGLKEKKMFEDNADMQSQNNDIVDLVRQTAFGNQGLGMPKSGVGNSLNDKQFREFQKKITPYNTIFSIANYPNQQQLISLIKDKIKKKYSEFLKRQPPHRVQSLYVGGYKQYITNQEHFQFALAYLSCPLNSEYMEMLNVVKTILGSASSFSSGGPGKGMHSRCTKNLLNAIPCVQKTSCINQHYQKHGLFGLTVGGPHQDSRQVIECTINEFKRLQHLIPSEELQRAKNILVAGIYANIQRQSDRLQQMSKHIFSYGRVRLHEYEQRIRGVTNTQIRDYIQKLMKTKPTLVLSGSEESIKNSYKQKEILKRLNS